jgi:hypothetical protein
MGKGRPEGRPFLVTADAEHRFSQWSYFDSKMASNAAKLLAHLRKQGFSSLQWSFIDCPNSPARVEIATLSPKSFSIRVAKWRPVVL